MTTPVYGEAPIQEILESIYAALGAADNDPHVLNEILTILQKSVGTWSYLSGVSGTVHVPADGRVVGIAAVGGTGGGSFTIDGGSSVSVKDGMSLDIAPSGSLLGPTLVFSNTSLYFVEWVT